MPGTLYVVATPIGNLSDLSDRAKRTLSSVDAVLCEDTRVTAKLLAVIGAKRTLVSLHQHSDERKLKEVVARLEAGESLALVTDAGTPGISDPGGILVEAVVAALGDEARIIPIPGPSALVTALSVSGFPSDRFAFLGFPPHKKGRQTYFKELAGIETTVVLYESTHRILKTLRELEQAVSKRPVVVCRELTKLHETVYRGTASEVTKRLESTSIRGEFVIVVAPR
ncbi:16S rRNA (cytidine(1402)-2'-O)-methyltransferase [Candidatus Uhrbacteria bacterium RIFCSPHIGHO2_01_FULL_63_20]|uniref:Ribosomal RNA small subunit methyltransferase I n=1 Tax=Candidatus Uhrbacteria bacterium RIFCSPHIGHO2_01_FULL_63_20 TaxID=1802385 RepID=A0A1F7TKF9_9BACT|nr:MAG: 16S rRNA (cytidine(1402)-2'-O)-methyltransferase [Candidatus Uhrbacteria bacterium RIFCSPHIGHO2_01_FULL_63_20]